MNVSETTSTRVLTTKELVSRCHSHQDVHLSSVAPQFNTGVIDVELLKAAGLYVPDSLLECQVVGVKYAATTRNLLSGRSEAVFDVQDSFGKYIGTYFANCFLTLKR